MYLLGPFSCNTLYQSAFIRLLYIAGKLLKFMLLEGANRYMQCFLKPLIKASTLIFVRIPLVKASHKASPQSVIRDVCSAYWERRVENIDLILHRLVFSFMEVRSFVLLCNFSCLLVCFCFPLMTYIMVWQYNIDSPNFFKAEKQSELCKLFYHSPSDGHLNIYFFVVTTVFTHI